MIAEIVRQVLFLNPQPFIQIQTYPERWLVVLLIVSIAGLSEAIGQCLVLFGNQVKPVRFVLSLFLSSFLFVMTNLFWAQSSWFVSRTLFHTNEALPTAILIIGLASAPRLLGFAIFLPYLGAPIASLLSIWSLLAVIVGVHSVHGLTIWQASVSCALGWIVLHIAYRTIGYPLRSLARTLRRQVAGVPLVTARSLLSPPSRTNQLANQLRPPEDKA